jgi:nicotinate-nucleotide adenylyltransferase
MDRIFDLNWNYFWIMKIGLLGGSFNPPHHGHLHISNLAIKKLHLNQVWWIPTAHNPLKEKSIYAPYVERLQKCENLTKAHPKIYVKKLDEIYTVKLLQKLKKQYPTVEFF